MSETLEQRVRRHEGFCFLPKPDSAFKGNNFVVGYGHDLTESCAQQYANGISEQEAEALLEADIAAARAEMLKELPWTAGLPQLKQDLICEMIFQLGIDGLFTFHNFLYCARGGDDAGAAKAMLNSLWHRQTPNRCEEMAELWLNGNTQPQQETNP
jgi:lysozyme